MAEEQPPRQRRRTHASHLLYANRLTGTTRARPITRLFQLEPALFRMYPSATVTLPQMADQPRTTELTFPAPNAPMLNEAMQALEDRLAAGDQAVLQQQMAQLQAVRQANAAEDDSDRGAALAETDWESYVDEFGDPDEEEEQEGNGRKRKRVFNRKMMKGHGHCMYR
jgi:hypothetical protein